MRHPKTGYVKTVKEGYAGLYYVRAVPKDVQAAIGKTKWSIPLDTANRAAALVKARALAFDHDVLIESHRRPAPPDPLESLSSSDRRKIEEAGGLEAFAARQTDRWHGANLAMNAAGLTLNYPPEGGDPAFTESEVAALKATANVLDSAIVADGPILNRFGVELPPRLRPTDSPVTLSDLCEKYLTARNPVNKNGYRNVAKAFEKVNSNPRLADITKQHVRAYRDSLATCGFRETTAKLVFKRLKTMLIFATEDDYLTQNPAATLPWAWPHVESIAEADDRARRTLSHEEAKRYLNAAQKLPVTDRTRWIILLMMFSGARGEELAQLSPDDVKNIGGVWCLSIHDREWRKLKTSNSLRDIPLHKRILELGFLDFVASRKGRQLLFSNRLATKETRCYPRHGDAVRAVLRNDAKVTDSRAVPYSARHSVKDCLRLVEAPRYVEDRILGHGSTANKIADGYGEAQILILKKWIDAIDPLDARRTTTTFAEDED